jgi:DNA polymerase (family 10)
MDSRSAAHVLSQIGTLLDLAGAPRFNARAYKTASRAILELGSDDLGPLLNSGELAKTKGVGPATLSVIRELVETGESSYLNRLSESTPKGLYELLKVPGLGGTKIHQIQEALGVESLDDLEAAALDGRLAKLPRFGPKTAERILKGIEFARSSSRKTLYHRGLMQALIVREHVARHPDVIEAIIAGSVRRHNEIVGDVDIVAVCKADPQEVAESLANAAGVKRAKRDGEFVTITYVDEVCVDILCAAPESAGYAVWRMTGNDAHVNAVRQLAVAKRIKLTDDGVISRGGKPVPTPSEAHFFRVLGLQEIPPELREGRGEVEAAAAGTLPTLVEENDIRGALHCHSVYSDGTSTIAELAAGARKRGWDYIGITDHSESAFYAGGLKRDKLAEQHDEIDKLNAKSKGFRILKGIEADILADGRVDYDDEILDSFDYVVGSIHSRFSMDGSAMTDRVLRALDDRHLTILGHPTGRLLLSREPYAIDIEAVIEKAAETGTAIELNADPHRLDIDWRHCRSARDRGVLIEIGPDAHSVNSLDNTFVGVGLARKGWLRAEDVLNTKSAKEVLAFAKKKRGL